MYPLEHTHLAKLGKVYFVVCVGVYLSHEGSHDLWLWCFTINFGQHSTEFNGTDAPRVVLIVVPT